MALRTSVNVAADAASLDVRTDVFAVVDDAVLCIRFPDRVILDVNDSFARVFGYSRDEVLGRGTDLIHVDAEHYERFGAVLRSVGGTGQVLALEWEFRRKDGTRFPAAVRLTVRAGEGGTSVAAGIVRDLTHQKRLEAAAREQKERTDALLRAQSELGDAVAIVSEAGIEWVNDAFCRLVGYTEEELTGGKVPVPAIVAPEEGPLLDERARRRREGDAATFRTQLRLRHRDGTVIPVELSSMAERAGEGYRVVCIARDLRPRREAEAELARVRAQLIRGERLAALGSLVSGVAHEIRTPLTYLANNAFLLQVRLRRAAAEGRSAADVLAGSERHLADLTEAVDRLGRIVEDLRRHTKARSAEEWVEASLHLHVADAVDLFRATHRGRLAVEVSLSQTAPVRADPGALQQVALNLLQNAAEASTPGASVRITTKDTPAGPVLEVADRGSGISADVQVRMYEPLFTTKDEGTGLGLSIVRRIVQEHGARIECESREGSGAVFRVVFPRQVPVS